jgi:Domain of unknown function (DUF1877)
MGMIGNYLRVTTEELDSFLSDSSKLENRVYNGDNHKDAGLLDVDKSWEAIFFLLTGQALATCDEAGPPFSWVLLPPNEIDPDQDMGFGPATYTTVAETKELSAAINNIPDDELRKRYDGSRMNEMGIYPECWAENMAMEYLFDSFNSLKNFYAEAANNNQAVIVFIN